MSYNVFTVSYQYKLPRLPTDRLISSHIAANRRKRRRHK